MQGSVGLDELDLGIVHALQISPRAPWSLVGEVLGVDPVTVTRRWNRLSSAGAAWIDGYLSPAHNDASRAHVEIVTKGSRLAEVSAALADDAEIMSLKQTSGSRDLLAIVVCRDLESLVEYVSERVSRIEGVRTTRIHVITAVPFEGSQWRLRSLTSAQRARLQTPEQSVPYEELQPLDRRIAVALGSDGRMPLTELAETVGTSVATARRRLNRLTSGGRVSLRCNLARPLSGRPVSAMYFASVPAEHLTAAATALRTLPELRLCAVTAGPHNLILDVWLRDLHDVHTLEAHLGRELKDFQLRINERAVVLRTVKHVGRVLDRNGHSVRSVPMEAGAQPCGRSYEAAAPPARAGV